PRDRPPAGPADVPPRPTRRGRGGRAGAPLAGAARARAVGGRGADRDRSALAAPPLRRRRGRPGGERAPPGAGARRRRARVRPHGLAPARVRAPARLDPPFDNEWTSVEL